MKKSEPFNGYRTIKNPCYDPKTGDCPNREAGCSQTCEKWAEHKKSREAVYDIRKAIYQSVCNYVGARKTKGRDKHYGGYG